MKTLGAAAEAAKAAGVACEAIQVEGEHPYQAIIDTATSKGCDLIVMASHGRRGIAALLLGSETVKVLTHSKIPFWCIADRPSHKARAHGRQRAVTIKWM